MLRNLGYEMSTDQLARTVTHHLERTSHGSTLSGVVTAWVLARYQPEEAWRFLQQALQSDVADVQGGTTAEGVHLGAMAGTVDIVLALRSEEHTSELQSQEPISYAVFCLDRKSVV